MSIGCQHHSPDSSHPIPRSYKTVLWIALILNAAMFCVELIGGIHSNSVSLQADALEFLGDTANYAISLIVLRSALKWRARASLLKALCLAVFGIWVLGKTIIQMRSGIVPDAPTMTVIAILAFITNLICVLLLFKFRVGDSNMRSVWLCSRNDAISNVGVLLAAAGVFTLNTGWPDWSVAFLMAGLALTSAVQITRQAIKELKHQSHHASA